MTSGEVVAEERQQSSVEVELFRTDDYHAAGRLPLEPLLSRFFGPMVGLAPERKTQFELIFLRVADAAELPGVPAVVNLRASHGWVQVTIYQDHRLVYRHPHSVLEIIGRQLQEVLRAEFPDETHWGYGVRAPGLEGLELVRPAPHAPHQVGISLGRRRARRFEVAEIPEPEPPVATLRDLGVDTDTVDPGTPLGVVVDLATFTGLTRDTPFSTEVEEGGFLAGTVYRTPGDPGSLLVDLTAAIPAERTGASMMHFTFTGESFLRIGRRLDTEDGALQLVGWYHTHLFPATDTLGLSSIDVELHTSTFRKSAQIAGLVNIEAERRVLRFYRSDGKRMVQAPFWVADR